MPEHAHNHIWSQMLKSLNPSSNNSLEDILGICGEEKQLVQLRVYRSEDESGDDDGIQSTGTTEATMKQKFTDAASEDEEAQIAEKLRECCDGFGREKPEMLGQSAACLLKLGELYKRCATSGEGIQQKLNFIKSSALIFGAMVRYEQLNNEEGIETSKREIRKLQDEIQIIASLKKQFNITEISRDLKRVLEANRVEVLENFSDVFQVRQEGEGNVRRERLEEVYEVSIKHYLDIIRKTAEECQDIMGNPPCQFAIVGLGSLARKEVTLYSDFQHAIVLEDGITDSPLFDEMMEYFRWYTTIFQIIIIGLGETPVTNIDVKSLNDLYSNDQAKKWFSDEYTTCGISFESMMPSACKIPLGRQEPTKRQKHTIELIQPVSRMVNLMTREEDIRNGYHLSEILTKTIFVYGNREVHNCYLEESHRMRNQQTEETFLEQQMERLFFPNITARHSWFLYAAQERLASLLSCMANLYQLRSQSGFEIVDELLDTNAIDYYMYYELMNAVAVGKEIKMKIHHLILNLKARNFCHIEVAKLVGEERVVNYFKTVMQYTILLQNQRFLWLTTASTMQLFPEETYLEENEVITKPLLSIQSIWKEIELGLGQTCNAIDKYEKHAEISSAEAKFVMRMASVAISMSMWFRYCTFISLDPLLLTPGLLFLPHDKLESHCRFLLELLKDDIQALIHYYPVIYLIHRSQKNFQQAYEDYENWKEICYSQQSLTTYRSNQSMFLDFLQMLVVSEVKVTDDMVERMEQQIATEAIPRRWAFTAQYCVALMKVGRKKEAANNFLMLARIGGKRIETLDYAVAMFALDDALFVARYIRCFLLQIFADTISELSEFLDIGNISGMKLQSSIQVTARYIRFFLTKSRTFQYFYCSTPLYKNLRLAAKFFVSDRRKSAQLLWKNLRAQSVTKPMMLDSILMIFRHLWHGLSLYPVAVDTKITDKDRPSNAMPEEHGAVTAQILDMDSTSTQAKPLQVESVSSTFLHQLQEERQEETLDNEGMSASNMQGDEESIIASESKNVPISKEGGEIDVGGCAVTFHRGSFDDVSKVHAKSEIDSSKWPPKYICISAMLWVHSERPLLKRASVAMKSWCMKNSRDSRKIEVHVLHLKNGSSTWDVVARLPLNDLKVFHFDCADFSPYVLGVSEDDLTAANHVIEGHIYAGKGNNFSLAFFLQHDLIKKSITDDMAMKQSEFQLNFSPISVTPNDLISANLKCMVENFRFPSDFKIGFIIDGDFVRLEKKTFSHSILIGTSNEAIDIPLECEVQRNDSLADGPHYFNYEWRPKIAPQRQQAGLTRVTTEIQGAATIRDLHLFGTGNTHDHRQYPGPGSAEMNSGASPQSQQGRPNS